MTARIARIKSKPINNRIFQSKPGRGLRVIVHANCDLGRPLAEAAREHTGMLCIEWLLGFGNAFQKQVLLLQPKKPWAGRPLEHAHEQLRHACRTLVVPDIPAASEDEILP